MVDENKIGPFQAYNLETVIFSIILIIVSSIVLGRECRGSKFDFILIILSLLIATNFFGMLVIYCNKVLSIQYVPTDPDEEYPPEVPPMIYPWTTYLIIWTQAISAFIRDASYNCAHWEFAYKYWEISYMMPRLLK
jgi:hypothetical protein